MPKVLSKRSASAIELRHAVYVGRPSPFGNPFVIGRDGNREEVIKKFRAWLLSQPALITRVQSELRGKDLVCWCSPLACHADVLLEVANSNRKEVIQ